MNKYIVNENVDENGYHEVHNEDTCDEAHLPYSWNRKSVGYYSNCNDAVSAAKSQNPYWNIDGCAHCSPSCHKY